MSAPSTPARVCAYGMDDRSPPLRSLEQYLAELQQQYDLLPMQSRLRGEIATRIRQVETEIDARAPL